MQADEKKSSPNKNAHDEQHQSPSREHVPGETDHSESDYMQQESTEPKKAAVLRWLKVPSNLVLCINALIMGGIFYQAYSLRESNKLTRQALSENTTQFNSILQEIQEQTVSAQTAASASKESARAAIKAANATETQVALAREQMEISKQQVNDAREALRLDQRPWLGYERYVIQARASDAPEWKEREPIDIRII